MTGKSKRERFETELERELYEALTIALPFVVVWGATYQINYGLTRLHPNHSRALDMVQTALVKVEARTGASHD